MLARLTLSTATLLGIAALFAVGGRGTAAGVDLTGTWDASYSLTCSATFEEMGTTVTADVQCGTGVDGALTGSLGPQDGAFTLSGMLGLINVNLEGAVTADLNTMEGTVSAPPLLPSGSFTGERESGGPSYSTTGDWTITFIDVFAGACEVEIVHSGSDVGATLACEDIVASPLEGSFDGETLTLSGPFSTFTELVIEAEVSSDGGSVEGTWTVDPSGLTGTFTAERRGGPAPQDEAPDDRDGDEEPTPTESVDGLPSTGAGGAGGDAARWWIVALASAGVVGLGGALVARRVL